MSNFTVFGLSVVKITEYGQLYRCFIIFPQDGYSLVSRVNRKKSTNIPIVNKYHYGWYYFIALCKLILIVPLFSNHSYDASSFTMIKPFSILHPLLLYDKQL